MIDYIKRWNALGVLTKVSVCEAQRGSMKTIRHSNLVNGSESPDIIKDSNFLSINLRVSNLVCLDVEGTRNSVVKFKEILSSLGVSLESLFYERSLNSGLHIYFRNSNNIELSKYKKAKADGIDFDFLYTGRAFTAPSYLDDKFYEWGEKTPFTINSLYEIDHIPQWLIERFLVLQ